MLVTITLDIRDGLKKGDRVSHRKTGSTGTVDRDELSGNRTVVQWDNMPEGARLRATRNRNLIRLVSVTA